MSQIFSNLEQSPFHAGYPFAGCDAFGPASGPRLESGRASVAVQRCFEEPAGTSFQPGWNDDDDDDGDDGDDCGNNDNNEDGSGCQVVL